MKSKFLLNLLIVRFLVISEPIEMSLISQNNIHVQSKSCPRRVWQENRSLIEIEKKIVQHTKTSKILETQKIHNFD